MTRMTGLVYFGGHLKLWGAPFKILVESELNESKQINQPGGASTAESTAESRITDVLFDRIIPSAWPILILQH